MKRLLKRITAMILAVIMAAAVFPPAVMAALVDNDPQVNREILTRLEELCGSPQEAEGYYALLQQYGLLDEDGNAASQWEIELDGEPVDLAGLRALLEEPDCDLTRYVWVDGTPLTLEEVKTMLEIEDYIAYLRETYFSGGQWSQEQLDNLDSLVEQMNTEGIEVFSGQDGGAPLIGASGIDHNAVVSMSIDKTSYTTSALSQSTSCKVTVSLNHPVPQQVSLKLSLWGGVLDEFTKYSTKTVTFEPNAAALSQTVTLRFPSYRPDISSIGVWEGARTFYVQMSDVQGAMVEGDSLASIFISNTSAKFPTSATYDKTIDSGFYVSPSFGDAIQYLVAHGGYDKIMSIRTRPRPSMCRTARILPPAIS